MCPAGSDKGGGAFVRTGYSEERASGFASDTYGEGNKRGNTSESAETESDFLRSDSIDTGGDIYQRNGGGRL